MTIHHLLLLTTLPLLVAAEATAVEAAGDPPAVLLAQQRYCDITERPSDPRWTQMGARRPLNGHVSDAEVMALAARVANEVDCQPGATDDNAMLCPLAALRAGPFVPPAQEHAYVGLSFDMLDHWTVGKINDRGLGQTELLFIGPRELQVLPTGPENECERLEDHQRLRELMRLLALPAAGPMVVNPSLARVMATGLGPPKAGAPDPFQGDASRMFLVQNPRTASQVYVMITVVVGGYRVSLFPVANTASWGAPPPAPAPKQAKK